MGRKSGDALSGRKSARSGEWELIQAASNWATASSRVRAAGSRRLPAMLVTTWEKVRQFAPNFLEDAFDGAFGAADFASDGGDSMPDDAQLHHLSLRRREAFQKLLDRELQVRQSAMVRSGGVFASVLAHGEADVAFAGAVIIFLGPDLVEGDDEEEPPQFVAGGHVIMAAAHAPEETMENGLHDVIGIDTACQFSGTARLDQ